MMPDRQHPVNEDAVIPEVQAALDQNTELRNALAKTELPLRFKAMVLGLSTLRQMNTEREGKDD
jgi:hypothetical protein